MLEKGEEILTLNCVQKLVGHEKWQSESAVSELTDDDACDCVSSHNVLASVSAAFKLSSTENPKRILFWFCSYIYIIHIRHKA